MALSKLQHDYPWITPNAPLIVAAPMMKITMAKLATTVSLSGGIGFLAAGFDLATLPNDLAEASTLLSTSSLSHHKPVPIGIGFQNWGASLPDAVSALTTNPVAIAWFFAPKQLSDLISWTRAIRTATNNATKIWTQVGTVAEALEVAKTSKPDVLVLQGADSGGHGLAQRAGITTLFPEVADALAAEGITDIPLIAAGGIMDARGAASALSLGADGVALGTRFLASHEAVIAKGYQAEILRVSDGGVSTVATKVYDSVRGIHGWPIAYNGRGVANMSYLDALSGMSEEENEALYKETAERGSEVEGGGWGPQGRMTTYAGTGVGLVREVIGAGEIVRELQVGAVEVLKRVGGGTGSPQREERG